MRGVSVCGVYVCVCMRVCVCVKPRVRTGTHTPSYCGATVWIDAHARAGPYPAAEPVRGMQPSELYSSGDRGGDRRIGRVLTKKRNL